MLIRKRDKGEIITAAVLTLVAAVITAFVAPAVKSWYDKRQLRLAEELKASHYDITVENKLLEKISYTLKSIDIKTGLSTVEQELIMYPGDIQDIPNFIEEDIIRDKKLVSGDVITQTGKEIACHSLPLNGNIKFTVSEFLNEVRCTFSGG